MEQSLELREGLSQTQVIQETVPDSGGFIVEWGPLVHTLCSSLLYSIKVLERAYVYTQLKTYLVKLTQLVQKISFLKIPDIQRIKAKKQKRKDRKAKACKHRGCIDETNYRKLSSSTWARISK